MCSAWEPYVNRVGLYFKLIKLVLTLIIRLLCKSMFWGKADTADAPPMTPHPSHFSFLQPDLQLPEPAFLYLMILFGHCPWSRNCRGLTLLGGALDHCLMGEYIAQLPLPLGEVRGEACSTWSPRAPHQDCTPAAPEITCLLSSFHPLPHFPHPLTMFPRITSQINYVH